MCGSMSQKANFYLLVSSVYPPLFMDQEIADGLFPLSDFFSNLMLEMGYFHIQATKPDTVGTS
jgi:juvenile hormone epoxide hydrolase